MLRFFSTVLLLSLFFFACDPGKNGPNTESPTPPQSSLEFEEVVYNKLAPEGCNAEKPPCCEVLAKYFKAIGGEEAIVKRINDKIQAEVAASLNFGEAEVDASKSIETYASEFLESFLEFLKDEPEFEMNWSMNTEMEKLFEDENRLCFSINNFSFTGGAHGNYFTNYLNFDKKTGNEILFESVIMESPKLSALLETAARNEFDIPEDETMKDGGFYYDGDVFPITHNIAVLKDSIIFQYNPYEIAPYVMGAPSFIFAKSDLKEVLK